MFRGFVQNVKRGTTTVIDSAVSLVSPSGHLPLPPEDDQNLPGPELEQWHSRQHTPGDNSPAFPATTRFKRNFVAEDAPYVDPLSPLRDLSNEIEAVGSPPKRQRPMAYNAQQQQRPLQQQHPFATPTTNNDIPGAQLQSAAQPMVPDSPPQLDTETPSRQVIPPSPPPQQSVAFSRSTGRFPHERSIFSPVPQGAGSPMLRTPPKDFYGIRARTKLDIMLSGSKHRWPRRPRVADTVSSDETAADETEADEVQVDEYHGDSIAPDDELRALQIVEQGVLRSEAMAMESDLEVMEKRAARPLPVPHTLEFEARPATNEDAIEMNTDNQFYHEKERKSRLGYVTATTPLIKLLQDSKYKVTQIEASLDRHRLVSSLKRVARDQLTTVHDVKNRAQAEFEAELEARREQNLTEELDEERPEDGMPAKATVFNERNPKSRLLARAEQRVYDLWNDFQTPEKTLVVDFKGMEVPLGEFRRLAPKSWLNDEIVNLYMVFLGEREARISTESVETGASFPFKRCHFFNSFFYSKLYGMKNGAKEYQFESVRRWTKKVDIFSLDRVIFPINMANSHWTCAMINIKDKTFEYFDSMGGGGERVLHHLERWLKDESMHKKKQELDTSDWRKISHESSIPQQNNADDCGVFAMKFVDYLSRGADFDFTWSDIEYFRTRMAHELLVNHVG